MKQLPHSAPTRGFTLVELLVVVAIIALLASVVMAGMSQAQQKSRDARRLEDINSLSKALLMYQVGKGHFPISIATTTLDGSASVLDELINEKVIPQIPRDPLQVEEYAYTYSTNSLGSVFQLGFCLETNSIRGYEQGCGNTLSQ